MTVLENNLLPGFIHVVGRFIAILLLKGPWLLIRECDNRILTEHQNACTPTTNGMIKTATISIFHDKRKEPKLWYFLGWQGISNLLYEILITIGKQFFKCKQTYIWDFGPSAKCLAWSLHWSCMWVPFMIFHDVYNSSQKQTPIMQF